MSLSFSIRTHGLEQAEAKSNKRTLASSDIVTQIGAYPDRQGVEPYPGDVHRACDCQQ